MAKFMEDKLDLQEPQPDPEQNQPPPRRKLTALEARKKYGIRSIILLALLCWFGYDGWYNPKFLKPEKKSEMWFNRVGAYILVVGLAYSGAMFISAAKTVQRRQQTGEVDESASPDE